ncbi:MAG: hypothetical protein WBA39_35215 [Rivularia sp. (in: cyanobacteria)]
MGRWGKGTRRWGDGESTLVGRLPPLREVVLAQRGVSLTRRGRWGEINF